MATAQQCRTALESLARRLSLLDGELRRAHLVDRTLSCHVSDLGVTFLTRFGPDDADPITEADDGHAPAQIRVTARSDDVLAVAEDPRRFGGAWLSGRLKVEGSFFDLMFLRMLILAVGGWAAAATLAITRPFPRWPAVS